MNTKLSILTEKHSASHSQCRLIHLVWLAFFLGIFIDPLPLHAAILKAEYQFNGTLSSSIPGAPDLVSVDPLGLNHFNSDIVNGQSQQVFTWSGTATPVNQQAGLALNPSSLVGTNNYSVEMICKLTDRNLAWRRLIDVSNRQTDNGFYVDPGNHLAVYPIISSITPYTNNVYEDIVLTVSGGVVSAYLNGKLQFAGNSSLMNLASSTNLMIFFVDNNQAGGQGEFSNGSIALLRIYDGALGNPTLSVQQTTTNTVNLTWESGATGFILQQNTDLRTVNWTAVAQTPSDNGSIKSVLVTPPGGNMFYRLYHP